jgi:ribose transport system ATP-binding protein
MTSQGADSTGGWVAPPAPKRGAEALIEAEHVSKTFSTQRVLHDVTLTIRPGEVHALLGENGSGKSTLIKILSGFHTPDPGSVLRIAGEPLAFGSTKASYRAGLRFVHQHLALVPEFNAVENMALDTGYGSPRWIHWKAQAAETRRLLERVGVDMDIWRPVSQGSALERSAVAIARAINTDHGRVTCVVLDEPTSRLPEPEVEQLFRIIRGLRRGGMSVIYVTHRLDEVADIADRVSVLRDGKLQGTVATSETTRERIVEMIVGRTMAPARTNAPRGIAHGGGRELVRVDGLSAGRFRDLSFTLRSGEIVGVVGLAGSGHEDIPRAIVGAIPRDEGQIWIEGDEVGSVTPRAALRRGIVLGLSNTVTGSAVKEFSVAENMSLASLNRYRTRVGRLRLRAELEEARRWVTDLDVRPTSEDTKYAVLSGGNQQKVILGKCLNVRPTVLVLENPTAGVDVGVRATIYDLIASRARSGLGILMCSTDLEDVTSTCHRVIVIRAGRSVAVLDGTSDEKTIMSLAAHGMDAGGDNGGNSGGATTGDDGRD